MDDYVKKHPDAKPFQNKGWPHFNKILLIISSMATGANVFFPTVPLTDSEPSLQDTSEGSSPIAAIPEVDGQDDYKDKDKVCLLYYSFISIIADIFQIITLQPSTSASKYCQPATPTQPKQVCANGAVALSCISDLIDSFNLTTVTALAPPPTLVIPTPICHTKAISFSTKKEKAWLSWTKLIHFINFLCRDQITTNVYMAIEEDDV